MAIAVLVVLVARHVIVCEMVLNPKQSNGFCLRPFAFYFPIQRGFSGSVLTLPSRELYVQRVYRGLSAQEYE